MKPSIRRRRELFAPGYYFAGGCALEQAAPEGDGGQRFLSHSFVYVEDMLLRLCVIMRHSEDSRLSPAVRASPLFFFFFLYLLLPETLDQPRGFLYLRNTCWLLSFIFSGSNILTRVPPNPFFLTGEA